MIHFKGTRDGFAMSASGARFERESGRQGQAPAISPAGDRMIKSVTNHPPFPSYFSFDSILRQMVKWRVQAMVRRREDAFYAAHVKGQPRPEDAVACEAAKYLPPRNLWKRPRAVDRKCRSAEQIASQSILRTVYGFRESRRRGASRNWLDALERLVKAVHMLVDNDQEDKYGRVHTSNFDRPRIILKRKGTGCYRALAVYERMEDRLILAGTSAYLRRMFDHYVSPHCHSFREDPNRSHQSAVGELIEYRKKHAGETLYVAECDIMKFFDVVDHNEARKAFRSFAEKCGAELDGRAGNIVESYLASYSFDDAMELARTGWNGRKPLPAEKLEQVGRVPKEVLAELHIGEDLSKLRLGLPQGGSLSPLFANILLAEADGAVVGEGTDPDLLYIRFCDDMIIVHTDRSRCEAAMRRYLDAVKRRKLPVHRTMEDGFAYGEEYYTLKTKGPFEWRQTRIGERNAAPWVSFLGYQIGYNGEVRVRKETIRKHLQGMKNERIHFDQRIAGVPVGDARSRLVRHFKAHLVAKGIGFLRAGAIRGDSLCWAAAFPNLRKTASRECEMQMKVIDAARDKMMHFPKETIPGPRYFFGRPFSYLGYLIREPRPDRHRTGMRAVCSDIKMYEQV